MVVQIQIKRSMAAVINKIDCKIMLLVGDTYQIESITFGNWFSMVKLFIPQYTWYELTTPYSRYVWEVSIWF